MDVSVQFIQTSATQKEADSEVTDFLTISQAELYDNRAVRLTYHNRMIEDEDEKMTYEDAIKYLENRTDDYLLIDNPETLTDVEHIERIIDIRRNEILITWGDSKEVAPLPRMLELFMERSLVIYNNHISFRYDQGSYDDQADSEMLALESYSNLLRLQMVLVDGSLYNQLLFYIKAAKNRNCTINISLEEFEGGFEKLFADLGWPWTDQMANWNNDNEGNREIKMNLEGDSNEYLIHNGKQGDEDMDYSEASESEGYCSE